MSEVFKVKALQVSVAVVCTRFGSCAAKGREGTRWQGDTWARGKDLAQRETGDRIISLGDMTAAFLPVSGPLCDGLVRSPTSFDIPQESG